MAKADANLHLGDRTRLLNMQGEDCLSCVRKAANRTTVADAQVLYKCKDVYWIEGQGDI